MGHGGYFAGGLYVGTDSDHHLATYKPIGAHVAPISRSYQRLWSLKGLKMGRPGLASGPKLPPFFGTHASLHGAGLCGRDHVGGPICLT